MNDLIGVAISTTGDPHRLPFLETCINAWREVLPLGSVLVVTVDGPEEVANRVYEEAFDKEKFGLVVRVGQPLEERDTRDGRLGVAANKNTGIEVLMAAGVEHVFLCDDDTWPLNWQALIKHIELVPAGISHSMVCWGANRLTGHRMGYATWNWPRGVMLYTHRDVIDEVGGMIEEFGPGGHEHVEWSRRIHQAEFTPALYCSPAVYGEVSPIGRATRASMFWNCEDMRKPRESFITHRHRRNALTSVRRTPEDWPGIEKIMAERDGDTSFVPFDALANGRASATLCPTSTGQGAGGEK